MSGFDPLYKRLIGFNIFDGKLLKGGIHVYTRGDFRIKGSWPLGKISLFKDHLVIRAMLKEYVLAYEEIVTVKKLLFFSVRIEHESADVPGVVHLSAPGLYSGMKTAAARNRLSLPFSSLLNR